MNFYYKLLPIFSTTLALLHSLLQKQHSWSWGPAQQHAFQLAKSQLTSSALLVHYYDQKELLLSCDASPYGIGAVLYHHFDDASEKPIGYASNSIAQAE